MIHLIVVFIMAYTGKLYERYRDFTSSSIRKDKNLSSQSVKRPTRPNRCIYFMTVRKLRKGAGFVIYLYLAMQSYKLSRCRKGVPFLSKKVL